MLKTLKQNIITSLAQIIWERIIIKTQNKQKLIYKTQYHREIKVEGKIAYPNQNIRQARLKKHNCTIISRLIDFTNRSLNFPIKVSWCIKV